MSGHSKWAQIKRSKGATDIKRGAIFTKLAREITIAAKQGVPDPALNFRLRLAVQHARENNMPSDNIDRAIKRASGAGEGGELEELFYEGYGPNGVGILIHALTDNRNRTVAEVRSTLTRGGGTLGEAGSVAWQFENRGMISVDPQGKDPEELALEALDLGADDADPAGEELSVYVEPAKLDEVRKALETNGMQVTHAEVAMMPSTQIELDETHALSLLKLVERLEDLDDVQSVYTNADFDESVLAKLG